MNEDSSGSDSPTGHSHTGVPCAIVFVQSHTVSVQDLPYVRMAVKVGSLKKLSFDVREVAARLFSMSSFVARATFVPGPMGDGKGPMDLPEPTALPARSRSMSDCWF